MVPSDPVAPGQADVLSGKTSPLEPARIDFVMPVYNEGANIGRALEEIYSHVEIAKRVLIVYDFDEDNTVPVARGLMARYPGVELIKNTLGKGVLNAVRAGIAATTAEVVIVTMADLSDDLTVVSRMESMIREQGYDVVCASRYMKGGQQIGGPWFKGFLSRMAGVSLYWVAGLPTHDATNAFRAYRRDVLKATEIESLGGFEYSLEITAKAFAAGRKIGEVPSTWRDRSAGESRFQLRKWLPQYLRWYHWTLDRSRRADRLALGTLLLFTLLFGLAFLTLRPELAFSLEYMMGEAGNQLYRADRIGSGAMLYRDVACQYGPIPVYLYALTAKLAGNTIQVNLLWHLGASLIAVGLAYCLLRRALGVVLSLGFAILVCVPMTLSPGGAIGTGTNAEHDSFERIGLLALMLLWRPVDRRSVKVSAAIGLVLGLLQGVKFRAAIVAVPSLVLLDLLTLPREDWRVGAIRMVKSWVVLFGVFALIEAVWIALAFALLPSWLAYETVFPAYIAPAYKLISEHYPKWSGVSFLLGQQLLPLSCLVFGGLSLLVWFAWISPRRTSLDRRDQDSFALNFGLFFFVIAVPIDLKQVFLIYRFAWILAFPAAWGFRFLKPQARVAVALIVLPTFFLMTKVTFINRPTSAVRPYRLPGGDVAYLDAKGADEAAAVGVAAASDSRGPGEFEVVLFSWAGGGYYHYYPNSAYPLRNYMTDEIALRAADADALLSALPRVRAFIITETNYRRGEDLQSRVNRTFPDPLARRILDEYRVAPERSSGRITVLVRNPSLSVR